MKKAISPQISSVLLIVLTSLIAVIILLWFLGFFSEGLSKFNAPIENSCNEIKFKASLVRAEGSGFPELQISNIGQIPIFDFNLRYIDESEKIKTEYIGKALEEGESASIEIIFSFNTETTRLQIIPVLLGQTNSEKNKQKICLDNLQEISLKAF